MNTKLILILYLLGVNISPLFCQEITYHKDIKPILCNHCISCHQEGGAGPMPLTLYEDVSSFGTMIDYVISNKIMPPWKANHSFSDLKDENYVSSENLRKIKLWVSSGLKEGQEEEFICQKDIPSLDQIDLKFGMDRRFRHRGNFKKWSQVFVIPTNLEEDTYVDGIEFIPGNKAIIRSCNIYIDTTTKSTELDNKIPSYGYANNGGVGFIPMEYIWHHWSPDQGAEILSDAVKMIPARSNILLHLTYGPSDTISYDSSSLHLSIVKELTNKKVIKSDILIEESDILNGGKLEIEPNDKVQVMAERELTEDVTILGLTPQGQYVCNSWSIVAIDQEGRLVANLLEVNNWDINWQRKYFLKEPIKMKPGYRIRAIAEFDNTEENYNLPILPPMKVIVGEAKRKEMFRIQFDYFKTL